MPAPSQEEEGSGTLRISNLFCRVSNSNEVGMNINSEVLNRQGSSLKWLLSFFMNAIKRYLQVQSRPDTLAYSSCPLNTRPGLVWYFPEALAWPSKRTREKHSLSAIQSARSWLRALIGESMTKYKDDLIFLSVRSS